MTLRRSRRRGNRTGLPAGITVASLLPLGLMVGASVLEDDDGTDAVERSPRAA